jgi:hypothetical protein
LAIPEPFSSPVRSPSLSEIRVWVARWYGVAVVVVPAAGGAGVVNHPSSAPSARHATTIGHRRRMALRYRVS